jgi:transposase
MRFVAVKTEEQQAAALVFRTRDLAVKQRAQLGNAIRGHLAEYGWVAPKGATHLAISADLLEGGEIGETLPETARPMFAMMIEMLTGLDARIAALDKEIARRAREDEVARRLMTIPGIGPITATALQRSLLRPRRSLKVTTSQLGWGQNRKARKYRDSSLMTHLWTPLRLQAAFRRSDAVVGCCHLSGL